MPAVLRSIAALTEHRDRDLLDREVLKLLAHNVPVRDLRLYGCVGDSPAQRLRLQAEARDGGPVREGQSRWTPLDRLPLMVNMPAHGLAHQSGRPVIRRNVGVYPVIADRRCCALVELAGPEALSAEQQDVVCELLRIYGNHLGLLQYGQIDTLTGLLNRKTFDSEFRGREDVQASEVQVSPADAERRADEQQLPRWLGVLDIDHFKKVNDGFGHLIGDEMLLLVAQLLRTTFRHSDHLYRFGGEEFVVLLRAEDRRGARIAFERFRRRMADYRFPQVGQATVSIGFTQLLALDSPAGAFARADHAVYHAKEHGRNQVHCHEDLVETGAVEVHEHVGEIELF
ncbi:MAG: GGDEF domain-containing protein [Steroidobacteraceae bacterium]